MANLTKSPTCMLITVWNILGLSSYYTNPPAQYSNIFNIKSTLLFFWHFLDSVSSFVEHFMIKPCPYGWNCTFQMKGCLFSRHQRFCGQVWALRLCRDSERTLDFFFTPTVRYPFETNWGHTSEVTVADNGQDYTTLLSSQTGKTLIKGEQNNNSETAENLSLIQLILPFIWLNLKRSTAGFSRVIWY